MKAFALLLTVCKKSVDFVLGLRMCMEHDYQKFQRRSQMNFEEMEQQISDYAKAHHAMLDYTA